MATTKPLTDAITALTTYANSVTGASDTTLSDAVRTLADGYGQSGGETLYYGERGQLYIKDVIIPESATTTLYPYYGCENLESITALGMTSGTLAYNCKRLKSVNAPKLTRPTAYFIRQQGYEYNALESVTIGSVGYPVTSLGGNTNWRYGGHAMTLTITIYVSANTLADIPASVSDYAEGNNAYAPSGSTVVVVYKNSTTGETITA